MLTVAQAAQKLGVSRERLHQFIRSGRLTANRNAFGFYEIEESDLKAFKKIYRKPGRPPKKTP